MIEEGRLKATIDQTHDLLEFENSTESFGVWDARVAGVCLAVNAAVERARVVDAKYAM